MNNTPQGTSPLLPNDGDESPFERMMRFEREAQEEARAAIRVNCCPVCWHELIQWENGIGEGMVEITKICTHCGWESDPYYE